MAQKPQSQKHQQPNPQVQQKLSQPQVIQEKQQSVNLTPERKIDSKKLGLVFYEIAKEDSALFNDDEKFPVMVSSMGVILALSTATLLNITQGMLKPELKNKKWFFAFGGFNLLAAGFLFGYGVYHMSNLYMKVSQQKWAEIEKEKNVFDGLSFSEKKKFMLKSTDQENNKKRQEIIQRQKAKLQEKISITK